MRSKGNPFITWGFGLIMLAIGFQLVWSILQQFKVAIGLGLIVICSIAVVRWIKRNRGYRDDLIIR